jgi:sulfite reductase (ferredoxin)
MPDRDRKSIPFRELLRIIGRGRKLQRDLTTEEAHQAMRLMLSGQVSDAQIGGFLVTMRVKEETADEIRGFAQAMREAMKPFPAPQVEGLVDLALPYNGKTRSLQTGVAAALVLAAAGCPVLLHGADDIPTKNGIAVLNLLRTLGYPADMSVDGVRRSIERTCFGVLNIEHVLPQWTALTPLRHHFGVRTLMNTVEKLINLASAPFHISGFYHGAYLARLATCLPAPTAWIVQGDEGSIDIRPGKKTRIYRAQGERMVEVMIDAADYGFPDEADLTTPIDPNAHAEQIRRALRGEPGGAFDQIALTAAVLLWMVGRVPDIHTGLAVARQQLINGQALAVLQAAQPSRSIHKQGDVIAMTWKERLQGVMPEDLAHEVDVFEGQIELRKKGDLDEKVFAETRLRRGVYGQRYDNGQRHDGIRTQTLEFPSGDLVKGPDTLWDAPGMQRIKLPFGGLTPDQMDVLADLAEEYSDDILHITTRQDIQLHYVHIDDTPDLMRRLAAVGITTREACGNSVRNVTACHLSGVCHDESFDVTPYSRALADFLLGHDDVQDFGRKVKIAFSGCEGHACALVRMHDIGFLARTVEENGQKIRGFTVFVGGGLGAVPHQAKVLAEFAREDEILPLTQAVSRVFARLGEKKNRNRARLKFLVASLGIDEFRRLVEEELKTLPTDDRHTAYIEGFLPHYREEPARQGMTLNGAALPDGFAEWYRTNVYKQRQAGYSTITVNLPLGDITGWQTRQLADIVREFVGQHARTTVEQNIVLRWVSDKDLPELYRRLHAIGLSDPGANTIADITACPGTDTCKLGIASSRGLAGELRQRLIAQQATMPAAVEALRIKVSGCFNSCGQHHVADIGFFGNSRRSGNHKVPHFQVVLGGQWSDNAGNFGLAMGAVPAKSVPDALEAITSAYVQQREEHETFQDWVTRAGKRAIKDLLTPFMDLPTFDDKPEFFTDWGDWRIYTIGDIGVGECAGEVVSLFSMEISRAESEHFDALVALDDGHYEQADKRAYQAMLLAARALVRTQFLDVGDDPDTIVREFKTRFYDTELFFDPFAKGKFARYLFSRHENPTGTVTADHAHQTVEEAQLFIEATHAAEARVNGLITS